MNSPKLIFLADDDASILEAETLILESEGYRVLSVRQPQAIEKKIIESKPDIVLLDIRMSGMDGLEICRDLKANPQTKNIPIIIVSAHRDIKVLAKNAQADDYLAKPFDMQDLLDLLEKTLQ